MLAYSIKTSSIQLLILILLVLNSVVFAQKKKPERNNTVTPDSTLIIQEKPTQPTDSGLPTIELKEHTIVGERIITNVPDADKKTDDSNIPIITANPTGEGKGNRLVAGAGGIKLDQSIFYPTTSIRNELYLSFGKYNDVNAGIKLSKQFVDDELFIDMDYRWNDGHVKNAEYNYFRNTFTNIHRFNRYIQNKIQFNLTNNTYKFYGARVTPKEQRARLNLDISSTTGINGWKFANIRWDAGIRYMDPDNSQLFNWSLWTDLNVSKTVGSSFLTSTLKVINDRIEIPLNSNQIDSLHSWIEQNSQQVPFTFIEKVRDDISNNNLLSEAFFGNFKSTLEHVFGRNLKVKGGVNIAYYKNNNKHSILFGGNKSQREELTTIYPIIGMEFNLGPIGTLFGKFEPRLENISFANNFSENPYVNISIPLSYKDVVSDIKIWWRRSGTYNLSFETFYNYKDINNYSIYIPQDRSTPDENSGHWDVLNSNDLILHEIGILLNWKINDYFSIWSSADYKDYSLSENLNADQVPYFPKTTFNFAIRALPGYGIQLQLNGQFISDQFASQFSATLAEDNILNNILSVIFQLAKDLENMLKFTDI